MLPLIGRPAAAIAVVVGLVLAAVPAHARPMAPAQRPTAVQAAPPMPAVPGVKGGRGGSAAISVPAMGNARSGLFTIFSAIGRPVSRTTIDLPTSIGTVLMGDWNGDGVLTPGLYRAGRWFLTQAVIGKPTWVPNGTFGGGTGDQPVVGRVDGDRVSDVGVFNAGTWRWRQSGDGTERTEQFGQAGDRPVVGDWNGDGLSDVGVFRGGTWLLRLTGVTKQPKVAKAISVEMMPDAQIAVLTVPFGLPTDTPVVGDWDGDGVDTPGVVRDGRSWILSKSLKKLRKSTTLDIPVAAGSTALVGSQATKPGHCPTASPAAEAVGLELASKVRPPARLKGSSRQQGLPEIKATVQDSLRYVMVNDYRSRLKDEWKVPYFDALTTHKTTEESVRRSANIAQAAAIMLTTSNWGTTQGITRKQLLGYTKWLIRSVACQHGSVTPGGWGAQWQSGLWAAVLGHAGWMLWSDLSPQERAYVAAMVANEADAVAARGPHYFRDRNGKEISPGNSKADEVSWDLTAPSLALAMMPGSKRAEEWRRAIVEYSIAAFARPSDLRNNLVVNGVNISQVLPGTNANEDGTITNHGIINPDYIQNVLHPWWGASLLRVGGVPAPEAMFLNADIVYRALTVVKFPSPPYAAPGGTVYQAGGQIYYPQGVNWGARRPATFTGVDSFAAQYSAPDTRAKANLAAHARDTRGMQLRYSDGRVYAKGTVEESYALGREEYALQQTALAWWASALLTGPGLKLDKSPVPGVDLKPRSRS